jgi:hypothetical protein
LSFVKGAAHRNIDRKMFTVELKGVAHRNILSWQNFIILKIIDVWNLTK